MLLNNESSRWLCKRRILQKLQEIPEISNIVSEWGNIKTIISQAADDSLWKYEAFTQKKQIKNMGRWNKILCTTEQQFSVQELSSNKDHRKWEWI